MSLRSDEASRYACCRFAKSLGEAVLLDCVTARGRPQTSSAVLISRGIFVARYPACSGQVSCQSLVSRLMLLLAVGVALITVD